MSHLLRKYVIEDQRFVPPFNEPASELSFWGKPLKIYHDELLESYFGDELDPQVNVPLGVIEQLTDKASSFLIKLSHVPAIGPCLVYRDSLFFDEEYLDAFYQQARVLAHETGHAVRAAYDADDPVLADYVLPLSKGFEAAVDAQGQPCFMGDLWYFPNGYTEVIEPLIIPTDAVKKGFEFVPAYMSRQLPDGRSDGLQHYLADRILLSIESWVHVYFANIIQGVIARASRHEERLNHSNLYQFKVLWRSLLEWKQFLSCSELVTVGEGTQIHPTATILGPTTIGENCFIGPGVVIDLCHIGDCVHIDQGSQLMNCVVGDHSFFPFRSAGYFSVFMDHVILAQNTCVQLCVIGRNTFLGAGNTFTDFNLLGRPIMANGIHGLGEVGQVVLGGCVGHNCRIGGGHFVVYPARMIESDVIIAADGNAPRVLKRDIRFEHSLHHDLPPHVDSPPRMYPRQDEEGLVDLDEW